MPNKNVNIGLRFLAALSMIAAGLFFSACGGGGSPHVSGTMVTGTVIAPNGLVAKAPPTGLSALFNWAYAQALGPEQPAGEAIVQLVRVDGSGNIVGTMSTTHTDSSGRFRVMLTPDTLRSTTLQVQVVGAAGATMRAFAITDDVTIDVRSELVIRRVLALGNSLDSLSITEALALRGYLESIDFTSYFQSTIDDTFTAIPAEVIADFDAVIDDLDSGGTVTPTGNYYRASMTAEIHSGNANRTRVDYGTLAYTGSYLQGPSHASLATWLKCLDSGGQPAYNITWQAVAAGGGPAVADTVTAGGSTFAIAKPAEVTIFNPSPPDFNTPAAYRKNAATSLYTRATSYSFIARGNASYEYFPLDATYNINYGLLLDAGFAADISVLVQKGTVQSSTINGSTYGYVCFWHQWDDDGWRDVNADLGTYDIIVTGGSTGTVNVTENRSRLRRGVHNSDFAVDLEWNSPDPTDPDTGEGTLTNPSTTFSFDGATGDTNWDSSFNVRSGVFAPDGSLLVLPRAANYNHNEGASINRGHSPKPYGITDTSLCLGVKLAAGNPTLTAGTYKVLWLENGFRTGGNQFVTIASSWTATVVNVNNIDFHGTKTTYDKTTDCDTSYSTANDSYTAGAPQSATGGFQNFNGAPCGYYRLDGGGVSYRGFWNDDATLGVFRVFNNTLDTGGDMASLGMAIFIHQ